MAALALVAAAALAAGGASADLPVGEAECGQTTCPPDTYCSSYDSHCRPCSNLCNPLHHNFEPKTCQNNCQAYIHDQRYVQRDADIIETLSRKVQTLTVVSSVALIIGVLLLVVGALYLARLLRAHRHLLWRFTKRGAARSCSAKQKVGAGAEDPEAAAPCRATWPRRPPPPRRSAGRATRPRTPRWSTRTTTRRWRPAPAPAPPRLRPPPRCRAHRRPPPPAPPRASAAARRAPSDPRPAPSQAQALCVCLHGTSWHPAPELLLQLNVNGIQ